MGFTGSKKRWRPSLGGIGGEPEPVASPPCWAVVRTSSHHRGACGLMCQPTLGSLSFAAAAPGLSLTLVPFIVTFAIVNVEHTASSRYRACDDEDLERHKHDWARAASSCSGHPYFHPSRKDALHSSTDARGCRGERPGGDIAARHGEQSSESTRLTLWHGASANQPSPRRERVGPEPEPCAGLVHRALGTFGPWLPSPRRSDPSGLTSRSVRDRAEWE